MLYPYVVVTDPFTIQRRPIADNTQELAQFSMVAKMANMETFSPQMFILSSEIFFQFNPINFIKFLIFDRQFQN